MPEHPSPDWQPKRGLLFSTLLLLGGALMLAFTLTLGAALLWPTARARACGLANTPTMIANNNPAIPTPVTPTSDPTQPVGFFPGAYYRAQSIDFTEDLSTVPNAPAKESLRWRWDFGDGTAFTSSAEPKHTYRRAGTFAVRVSIYDSVTQSWVDFDSATITVLGQAYSSPPIAKAAADKTVVAINDSVTFDSTGSKPLVGSAISYEWNFGDATPDGLGQHVPHVFTIPGRALVTLLVTDSRGALSTAVIPITIAVSIPKVHLQVSATTASVNQAVTFDASQVEVSAGNQVTKYIWDFGDQSSPQTTTTSTITHQYAKPGHYHMQVQAIDTQNVPGTATVDITIQAANADTGKSPFSFTTLAIGLLILLILGALVTFTIQRRRPVPTVQRRSQTQRGNASRRTSLTGRQIQRHPPRRGR